MYSQKMIKRLFLVSVIFLSDSASHSMHQKPNRQLVIYYDKHHPCTINARIARDEGGEITIYEKKLVVNNSFGRSSSSIVNTITKQLNEKLDGEHPKIDSTVIPTTMRTHHEIEYLLLSLRHEFDDHPVHQSQVISIDYHNGEMLFTFLGHSLRSVRQDDLVTIAQRNFVFGQLAPDNQLSFTQQTIEETYKNADHSDNQRYLLVIGSRYNKDAQQAIEYFKDVLTFDGENEDVD